MKIGITRVEEKGGVGQRLVCEGGGGKRNKVLCGEGLKAKGVISILPARFVHIPPIMMFIFLILNIKSLNT